MKCCATLAEPVGVVAGEGVRRSRAGCTRLWWTCMPLPGLPSKGLGMNVAITPACWATALSA